MKKYQIAIVSAIIIVAISVSLGVIFRPIENTGLETGSNSMNNQQEKESVSPSYIRLDNGIQVVTITASEFKFSPSEIHISQGKTKFVLENSGKAIHEMVAYESSKKDIVDQAELAEDEDTISKNIIFEIEEVLPGEKGESDVLTLEKGAYVIGCHVPGHYEQGMMGTMFIE